MLHSVRPWRGEGQDVQLSSLAALTPWVRPPLWVPACSFVKCLYWASSHGASESQRKVLKYTFLGFIPESLKGLEGFRNVHF